MPRALTPITVLSIHPLNDTRVNNHLLYLVRQGYQVTYLNWSDQQRSLPPREEFSRVRLIHHHASPVVGLNFVRLLWMIGWFKWHGMFQRGRLVHLHDALILPVAMPMRLLGKRVVFDVHEHYPRFPGCQGVYYRLCYAVFLPFVSAWVGVSDSTLPGTHRPHAVIPNYQSRESFDALEPPEPIDPWPGPTVVYFGSLFLDDRDVALLLDVAEMALEAVAEVRFKIGGKLQGAGMEAFDARLKALAQRYGPRFQWFGVMPRDQVIRHSLGADVGLWFIKDVANLYGASPNKIFEYLTTGSAIVATRGFACSDEVEQGGAAILVKPGVSAAEAGEALVKLLREPSRLARMKDSSRRLGMRYAWEAVVGRYGEIYRRIASASSRID